MGFYCPIEFKDNLKKIEPRFPKNLRTNEAHSDFTGPSIVFESPVIGDARDGDQG